MFQNKLQALLRNSTRSQRTLRAAKLVPVLATSALLTVAAAMPLHADYGENNYTTGEGYGADYQTYEESDASYSYASVVQGTATLLTVGGEREALEVHQPVLVGDQLWVPHGARIELVLSDRSLLRVEGEAELTFQSLAFSSDTNDQATLIRLERGQMQLVVPRDVLGSSLARIETPGASVILHEEGTFKLSVGRHGATTVIVREGLAELVAERGSRLVHPGESGWGSDRGGIEVARASYRDGLERWGDDLSYQASRADVQYVDSSIRYAAAPLARHGGWLQVGSRHAWRPHHRNDWRPYSRGYWRHTPIGVTWVSQDPWGYVTSHYGSWDYDNGHGWLWYPGRRYAPARVTWYWGPSYVGWCPTGYYSNYYRRQHSGFNLNVGIYGFAGRHWDRFASWNFTANLHFGNRRHRRNVYSGRDMGRRGHRLDVGIVTSHPGRHARRGRNATDIYASLRGEATRHQRASGRDLPDVTDFVGRGALGDRVATRVLRPERANKPLIIDRGAAGRNNGAQAGTRGAGTRTSASGTNVAPTRRPTGSSAADKPAIVRGAAQNKPATSSRTTVRHVDRSNKPSDRTVKPRPTADKPAIPSSTRTVRPRPDRPSASSSTRTVRPRTVTPQPRRDDRSGTSSSTRTVRPRTVTPQPRRDDRSGTSSSSGSSSRSTVRPRTVTPQPRRDNRPSTTSSTRTVRPRTVTPQPRRDDRSGASSSTRTVRPRTVTPQPRREVRPPSSTSSSRRTVRPAPTPRPQAPRAQQPRQTRPNTRSVQPAPRSNSTPRAQKPANSGSSNRSSTTVRRGSSNNNRPKASGSSRGNSNKRGNSTQVKRRRDNGAS